MRSTNEFTSRRERWQAAPESTYREGEYIDKLSKNKTAVVVKLIDGEEVRGWIEYYDKDIIRITRSTEPNLFAGWADADNFLGQCERLSVDAGKVRAAPHLVCRRCCKVELSPTPAVATADLPKRRTIPMTVVHN